MSEREMAIQIAKRAIEWLKEMIEADCPASFQVTEYPLTTYRSVTFHGTDSKESVEISFHQEKE